jgi:hypothetical protein
VDELLCFPRLPRAIRNNWRRSCGSVMHCLLPVKQMRNRRYVWKKFSKYTISIYFNLCTNFVCCVSYKKSPWNSSPMYQYCTRLVHFSFKRALGDVCPKMRLIFWVSVTMN